MHTLKPIPFFLRVVKWEEQDRLNIEHVHATHMELAGREAYEEENSVPDPIRPHLREVYASSLGDYNWDVSVGVMTRGKEYAERGDFGIPAVFVPVPLHGIN